MEVRTPLTFQIGMADFAESMSRTTLIRTSACLTNVTSQTSCTSTVSRGSSTCANNICSNGDVQRSLTNPRYSMNRPVLKTTCGKITVARFLRNNFQY